MNSLIPTALHTSFGSCPGQIDPHNGLECHQALTTWRSYRRFRWAPVPPGCWQPQFVGQKYAGSHAAPKTRKESGYNETILHSIFSYNHLIFRSSALQQRKDKIRPPFPAYQKTGPEVLLDRQLFVLQRRLRQTGSKTRGPRPGSSRLRR